jgi:hypothetical protein
MDSQNVAKPLLLTAFIQSERRMKKHKGVKVTKQLGKHSGWSQEAVCTIN